MMKLNGQNYWLFISNNTFDLNKDNITFLELGDFREEKLTYFRTHY